MSVEAILLCSDSRSPVSRCWSVEVFAEERAVEFESLDKRI